MPRLAILLTWPRQAPWRRPMKSGLEPLDYQIEGDGKLQAHLVKGELFEGFHLAWLPKGFRRFELDQDARDAGREPPGRAPRA